MQFNSSTRTEQAKDIRENGKIHKWNDVMTITGVKADGKNKGSRFMSEKTPVVVHRLLGETLIKKGVAKSV